MHAAVALLDVVQVPLQDGVRAVENGDVRAEFLHGRHLVRAHDQIFALRDLVTDDVADEVRVHRVEAGKRFVQDDQFGIGQESGHELDLLLVALGKLLCEFRLFLLHAAAAESDGFLLLTEHGL